MEREILIDIDDSDSDSDVVIVKNDVEVIDVDDSASDGANNIIGEANDVELIVVDSSASSASSDNSDSDVLDIDMDNVSDASLDELSEIEPLADSGVDSECSEDYALNSRFLNTALLLTISDTSRMCVNYFYYAPGHNMNLCTPCFMRISTVFTSIHAVREHTTCMYGAIVGKWCCDCGGPLHQILLCNMCPVCMH